VFKPQYCQKEKTKRKEQKTKETIAKNVHRRKKGALIPCWWECKLV
jgi:hypothetical protein